MIEIILLIVTGVVVFYGFDLHEDWDEAEQ